MKHLKVRVGPKGEGIIWLDGKNISDKCVGVDIQAYAGEHTRVTLAISHLELDIDIPLAEHPEFLRYGGSKSFH